jgi:glycosyltransferase involved in cell wall biosynthesis
MNILYITQWFSPIGGGGEVVFYNLATGMACRGHNIEIVCAQSSHVSSYKKGRIVVNAVKPRLDIPPPTLSQNALFIIRAVLKGYQIVLKNKIEIIHVNNLASAIAGSILAKISNKPLITTVHDVFSTSSPSHWNHWTKQDEKISRITYLIAPIIEKIAIKMPTDIIHTVSNSSKDDLINFGANSKIEVIPNGVDLFSYPNNQSTIEYQNFVLFIGRLVFYKNLDVIIHSFKDVVMKLPGSKMYIVGEGPMRHKWEKMVSDMGLTQSIEFTGYVADEKKVELLSKCSALLLPSFVEGFGLVILESFAMSKPVLVADVKPASELVNDGIDGFILPVNNPTKWSEKVSYLLDNKEICRKMGINARTKLERKYSLEFVIDNIESLYLSLLAKKSKTGG